MSSVSLDRERRDIAGDKPPDLFGVCGASVHGTFYIFAGCNNNGYTNEVLFSRLELLRTWGKRPPLQVLSQVCKLSF